MLPSPYLHKDKKSQITEEEYQACSELLRFTTTTCERAHVPVMEPASNDCTKTQAKKEMKERKQVTKCLHATKDMVLHSPGLHTWEASKLETYDTFAMTHQLLNCKKLR